MTALSADHLSSYRRMECGEPYEPAAIPYFPHWAYREFQEAYPRGDERPLYASMAITSGGYKRNSEYDIGNVIAMNTKYGALLRDYLSDNGIGPSEVIIPSELGSMRQAQWGQLDFLMLWYHIMAGVHEKDAVQIENRLRAEGVYTDAKWAQKDLLGSTDEDKWNAYKRFTDGYAAALSDARYTYEPVKAVLGVLDGEMSLGGKAEKLLARHLGVPFYTLEAQENTVSEEFRQELETLSALGARAVKTFPEHGPWLVFRPAHDT